MRATLTAAVLMGLLLSMLPVLPAHSALAPSDQFNIVIRNEDNDKCLTAAGAYNGAAVYATGSCSSSGTRWDVLDLLNGYHVIKLRGTNFCVTTPAWSNFQALLYTCELHHDQQWSITTFVGNWFTLPYIAWFKSRIDWQSDGTFDCLTAPSWTSRRARLYTCNLDDDNPWWDQLWVVQNPFT